MKKTRLVKRTISILCAMILSVSTVLMGLPGEAAAAAGTLPPTDFTEISWGDFTGLMYKEYVAPDPGTGAVGTYSQSLNGTLFNGNVIMGWDTDIRYAGQTSNAGWSGFEIHVNTDGTLTIAPGTYGGDYQGAIYQPADYGLTSFIDNEFNLKVSTEISGTNYTFGVWVNDQLLGDYFTVTGPEDAGNATIGVYHRGGGHNVTLKYATVAVPTDLTELGWTNFLGLTYKEYVAPDPGLGASGEYNHGLHNTLLNGNIIMGSDVDIRFGGTGWSGLMIRTLTDGTLAVEGSTFNTPYSKVYQPSAFGLESFIDTEFNLKISTQISGNDYTFGVWVNDQILGDYFTLTETDGETGNKVTFYKRDLGNNVTLLKAAKEIPTDFKKLRWSDFDGFQYKEYVQPKGYAGTYAGSLDKTLLSGDIIFGKETDIRFAGQTSNPGWSGVVLRVNSEGNLMINHSTYDTLFDQIYQPEDYGLESFADTKFNLKISTEISGNNRTFGIWINDIFVDCFTLTESDGNAGSIIGLYDTENGNNITLVQTPVVIPTDFTNLNWIAFNGLEYKEYIAPDPGADAKGTYSSSLNRTLLNGNVIMGYDTDIRYAGQTSNAGWSGFEIHVNTDGTLSITRGTYGQADSGFQGAIYQPEDYGLTSFIDNEFNLKVSTEIDGTDYTFAVWVNNKVLGDYFTVTGPADPGSATVGFYHRGGNHNVTLKAAPDEKKVMFTETDWTGYQTLTPFTSYGIEAGAYEMAFEQSLDRNPLVPMDKFDKVILQFHEISYDGDVDLGFGGGNVWTGFRLRSQAEDGTLTLRSGYSQGGLVNQLMPTPFKLFDDVAGVDLVGGTYNLKISMVYVNETTIQIGLWFNDVLYNNCYVMVDVSNMDMYEVGDVLGTSMGIVCQSQAGGTITLAEQVVSLDTYWNKADGAFTAPGNATDGAGNGVTTLSQTGDYFITYQADGAIYEENVYVWLLGDATTDDEVNLHDLIRMKKLIAGDEAGTAKAGKKGADIDANSTIDSVDADELRELLLGGAIGE